MDQRRDANGVLVIDKPAGITSHDVVARTRRTFRGKVGHTGTLDPVATGVLPLVIGKATRLASLLQTSDKVYEVELRLGVETDTYDSEGRVTRTMRVPQFSAARRSEELARFRGCLEQQVPPFSAVRVQGERLYKAARRGETPRQLPVRQVCIDRIELLECKGDRWTLLVECSAGTYIRSLVHDLGRALKCGASVTALRRTGAGSFSLSKAVPLHQLEARWQEAWLSLEELLPEIPRIDLDLDASLRVRHGHAVTATAAKGRLRLFYQGLLVAIGESDGALVRPKIVLRG